MVCDPVFITMKDGVRLSARLWVPRATFDDPKNNPCPVILEQLAYRRRDGTSYNDNSNHYVMARHGFIGARVDFRGFGDSEGFMEDEMTPHEQGDIATVIEFFSQQNFCNGKVGMIGYSWGGNNSALAAATAVPGLGAVIAADFMIDRYHEDLHYKGGVPLFGSTYWGASMLSIAGAPPDPQVQGSNWRDLWRKRLDKVFCQSPIWKQHSARDDYWRHGSVAKALAEAKENKKLPVPILAIGGWYDCYADAPADTLRYWPNTARGMMGPWGHSYPHWGQPEPNYDFYQDMRQWFGRWLKPAAAQDEKNNAESWPAFRAFLIRAGKPINKDNQRVAGNWVGVDVDDIENDNMTLYLRAGGKLSPKNDGKGVGEERIQLKTIETVGACYGKQFPVTLKEYAKDQQPDDDKSLCFETAPFDEELDMLGRAQLQLTLKTDQPFGNIIARLVDVHPDGTANLITHGCLNLAHRHARRDVEKFIAGQHNPAPTPMAAGQDTAIVIDLLSMGYTMLPGHRLRLALSTHYFPICLPPPFDFMADVDLTASRLILPQLKNKNIIALPTINMDDVPHPQNTYDESEEKMVHEKTTDPDGRVHLRQEATYGWARHPDHDTEWQEAILSDYSIIAGDPLSARLEYSYTNNHRLNEDGKSYDGEVIKKFSSQSTGRSLYYCDKDFIYIEGKLTVMLDGAVFFNKEWKEKIKREFF